MVEEIRRTWAEPADRDLHKTSKGTAEEQAELSLLGFKQIEDGGNVYYCHAKSGLIIYLYSNNKWWCKDGTPNGCKAQPGSSLQDFYPWFKERLARPG